MSDRIIARARASVGARFRPQGRSVDEGFDCVGVVGAAFSIKTTPRNYALRGGCPEHARATVDAAGLRRVDGEARQPGDVLLVTPGPRQLHLVILTDCGFVHADAGLRRVVETPGSPPWPVLGAWRKQGS